AEAWRAVIGPENADKRLFFRPLRARGATQVFHFVVCGSVSRAGHIGRRRRAELSRRVDDKGDALAPVGAQRERDQTDRILAPMSGQIAWNVIDADTWLGDLRTIIETHRQDGCSRTVPQVDPVCSLLRVGDGS